MRVSADGGGELPVGPKLDGVDLMPYLRGKTQGESHETLFWRGGYHQAVQHRGWKLICSDLPAGAKWLFNLIEDPTEHCPRPLIIDKHGGQPCVVSDEYICWPN